MVNSGTLIEQLIEAPFATVPMDARNRRDRVWLERMRAIFGVLEEDAFLAAAWERYFREAGDTASARREAAYLAAARAHPLSFVNAAATTDYAVYGMFAVNLAFTAMVVLLWEATPRSRHPRAVLAGLVAIALSTGATATLQMVNRFSDIPYGDVGHLNNVSALDDRLKEDDTNAVRYAAAVAHHFAGDVSRARELYESIPNDARARTNLQALTRGVLTPPEALTDHDVRNAFIERSWTSSLGFVALGPFALPPIPRSVILLNVLVGCLTLAARRRPASAPVRIGSMRARVRAFIHGLIPGALDLRCGSPLFGYALLTAATFVLLVAAVLAINLRTSAMEFPAAGFVTLDSMSGSARAWRNLLPRPAGAAPAGDSLAYYYWTMFFGYPYATAFLIVIAGAAAATAIGHAVRVRTLWAIAAHEGSARS
jgi:hypothetical protein